MMVVIVFRRKDGMRQNATKDSIVFAHNCFTGYEIGKTIKLDSTRISKTNEFWIGFSHSMKMAVEKCQALADQRPARPLTYL